MGLRRRGQAPSSEHPHCWWVGQAGALTERKDSPRKQLLLSTQSKEGTEAKPEEPRKGALGDRGGWGGKCRQGRAGARHQET